MTRIAINLTALSLITFALLLAQPEISPSSGLTGPYLGQKPPGITPEIFAPGLVSTSEANIHSTLSFSPDGRELFFARLHTNPHRAVIYCMAESGYGWRAVDLDTALSAAFSPSASPDGNLLLLAKGNALALCRRIPGGWGSPEQFGSTINFQRRQDGASMATNGSIYFTSMFGGKDGIYYSSQRDGKYSDPRKFDTGYNGQPPDGYPFIAPDESYMIFMSWRPGGFGMWDLYITFRRDNGSWTSPVNMGSNINTAVSESFPSVSSDGKYLFFNSNRKSEIRSDVPEHFYGNIYWVSAEIIKGLRPKE